MCGVCCKNVNATVLKRRENSHQVGSHNPARGEAKGTRERKGRDGCVVLLGRSHEGSPEAGGTLTMNSHGIEISIAEGGADEKHDWNKVVFFLFFFAFFSFFFLNHVFVVKYKKQHGALAMAETKL